MRKKFWQELWFGFRYGPSVLRGGVSPCIESIAEADKIVAAPEPDYRDGKIVELEKEVANLIADLGALKKIALEAQTKVAMVEATSRVVHRQETEADLLFLCVCTAISILAGREVAVKEKKQQMAALEQQMSFLSPLRGVGQAAAANAAWQAAAANVAERFFNEPGQVERMRGVRR